MDRVLLPSDSGLLSAYGLSCARLERLIDHPVLGPIVPLEIGKMEPEMIARGKAELLEMGERGEVIEKRAFIRLVGQDSSLEVIYREPETLVSSISRIRTGIRIFSIPCQNRTSFSAALGLHRSTTEQEETFVSHGQIIDRSGADGMDRSEIRPGQIYAGPLLVADAFSTLWVAVGWTVRSGSQGVCCWKETKNFKGRKVKYPRLHAANYSPAGFSA